LRYSSLWRSGWLCSRDLRSGLWRSSLWYSRLLHSGLPCSRKCCYRLPSAPRGTEFNKIFLLPGEKIRAVYLGHGHELVLMDHAAGRASKDIRHPAIGGCDQPVYVIFIGGYAPQGSDPMGFRDHLHGAHLHTYDLLFLRSDFDAARRQHKSCALGAESGGFVVAVNRFHWHAAGCYARFVRGMRWIHGVYVVKYSSLSLSILIFAGFALVVPCTSKKRSDEKKKE
jgi:hypothetical protein